MPGNAKIDYEDASPGFLLRLMAANLQEDRNQRIIEMQQRLFVNILLAFPHAFLLLAAPAYALNRSRWEIIVE
jgi:hypothetical protein